MNENNSSERDSAKAPVHLNIDIWDHVSNGRRDIRFRIDLDILGKEKYHLDVLITRMTHQIDTIAKNVAIITDLKTADKRRKLYDTLIYISPEQFINQLNDDLYMGCGIYLSDITPVIEYNEYADRYEAIGEIVASKDVISNGILNDMIAYHKIIVDSL